MLLNNFTFILTKYLLLIKKRGREIENNHMGPYGSLFIFNFFFEWDGENSQAKDSTLQVYILKNIDHLWKKKNKTSVYVHI